MRGGRFAAFPARREGQSLVEVALALPVLLVVLIGALEGARVLTAAIAVSSAVLAGAHYGAISSANASNTAGISAAVQQELSLAGLTGSSTVTSTSGTDADGEKVVTVQATYTWRSLFAYPGLPKTVAITRTAAAQVRR